MGMGHRHGNGNGNENENEERGTRTAPQWQKKSQKFRRKGGKEVAIVESVLLWPDSHWTPVRRPFVAAPSSGRTGGQDGRRRDMSSMAIDVDGRWSMSARWPLIAMGSHPPSQPIPPSTSVPFSAPDFPFAAEGFSLRFGLSPSPGTFCPTAICHLPSIAPFKLITADVGVTFVTPGVTPAEMR
ncbi:hypothetical protein KR009_009689 [Drosophila setifemur]|nr:hypothetical protein KR009_009689 [Drosophila setifemur]